MDFKTIPPTAAFPYPYIPEVFTASEKKILLKYFTNFDKPVFAIYNLPQEVVGAMFSRYSRSAKSVRRLFLDEFWNSELGLKDTKQSGEELQKALGRTKNFYQKVFAEFGDDSVIQMGSMHIAFENISQMIGAKAVEDTRIGAAYIEKSTRYVDFGSKIENHYLFMEPAEIMNSSYAKEFIDWNNELFDAYNRHLPVTIDYLSRKYPLEIQQVEDTTTHELINFKKIKDEEEKSKVKAAYTRALKAKALDTIRFFLPLTTVTNLGALFTGQSAEMTINKMLVSPYSEVRTLGTMALEELQKISPNFLQNIDHPFGEVARNYRLNTRLLSENIAEAFAVNIDNESEEDIKLISTDADADCVLASHILYTFNKDNLSLQDIVKWAKAVKRRELKGSHEEWSKTLIKIIYDSLPDRTKGGVNRRQKLPRAFEQVFAEVEFYDNIGTFKDLQRHRMCTIEKQYFHADDIYIPLEYKARPMKSVYEDYIRLVNKTVLLQEKLIASKDPKLIHAAEYVTILGNKVRFTIKANLRQWVFLAELRTIAGGHPTYRHAIQEAARQIITAMPFMKKLFTHVDWKKDYGLGRLKAEINTERRLAELHVK